MLACGTAAIDIRPTNCRPIYVCISLFVYIGQLCKCQTVSCLVSPTSLPQSASAVHSLLYFSARQLCCVKMVVFFRAFVGESVVMSVYLSAHTKTRSSAIRRESAHLTWLYCTVQKAFQYETRVDHEYDSTLWRHLSNEYKTPSCRP